MAWRLTTSGVTCGLWDSQCMSVLPVLDWDRSVSLPAGWSGDTQGSERGARSSNSANKSDWDLMESGVPSITVSPERPKRICDKLSSKTYAQKCMYIRIILKMNTDSQSMYFVCFFIFIMYCSVKISCWFEWNACCDECCQRIAFSHFSTTVRMLAQLFIASFLRNSNYV